MKFSYKSAFLLMVLCTLNAYCEDYHHHTDGHEPEHIHTIHHHHIQKYEIIKKVEVPVIKEVKVPYFVYVPVKAPYKYMVEPLMVKVPVEYYHTESNEHDLKQNLMESEHHEYSDGESGGGAHVEEEGHHHVEEEGHHHVEQESHGQHSEEHKKKH